MRKRKIKFALELKNGEQAYSIEDLREHFDLEKVIGYYHDNKLIEWLEDRFYADEAEKIQALDSGAKDFNQKLCEILGAECEEVADAEDIVWRKERLERLKQYTADPEILDKVDFVAFDQYDLEDIAREEDTNVVYLCGAKFRFPSGILRKKGVRYIGIGKKVTAKIESGEFVDLAALNISFDNVEVEGNYKKNVINKAEKNNSNQSYNEDIYDEFFYLLFNDVFKHKQCGFKHDKSMKRVSNFNENIMNECFCILRGYPGSTIAFSKKYFLCDVNGLKVVNESGIEVSAKSFLSNLFDFNNVNGFKKVNYSKISSIDYNSYRLFIYMKNRDQSFSIDWHTANKRVGIAIKIMSGLELTVEEKDILDHSEARYSGLLMLGKKATKNFTTDDGVIFINEGEVINERMLYDAKSLHKFTELWHNIR